MISFFRTLDNELEAHALGACKRTHMLSGVIDLLVDRIFVLQSERREHLLHLLFLAELMLKGKRQADEKQKREGEQSSKAPWVRLPSVFASPRHLDYL
jgi:hypothetical protein